MIRTWMLSAGGRLCVESTIEPGMLSPCPSSIIIAASPTGSLPSVSAHVPSDSPGSLPDALAALRPVPVAAVTPLLLDLLEHRLPLLGRQDLSARHHPLGQEGRDAIHGVDRLLAQRLDAPLVDGRRGDRLADLAAQVRR